MELATSNKVIARNSFGQFISDCQKAGDRTIQDAVEQGAQLSRQIAPHGSKPDPRSPHIRDSITSSANGHSGSWTAHARHALAVERGARAHTQPANVTFFWDKVGRMWMHPETYQRVTGFPGADPIHHPATAAQPFLRPAYEIIMSRIMGIARQYYPGG